MTWGGGGRELLYIAVARPRKARCECISIHNTSAIAIHKQAGRL